MRHEFKVPWKSQSQKIVKLVSAFDPDPEGAVGSSGYGCFVNNSYFKYS